MHSHRHGDEIFETKRYQSIWYEIDDVLSSITEGQIIKEFENQQETRKTKLKSISKVLNPLIKAGFRSREWTPESQIFESEEGNTWRLDFSKDLISVEVGFNHGEAMAWNLIKPTLASQITHLQRKTETTAGVVITATQNLKIAGGFDNAIGTFEDYVRHLGALQNIVTIPLVIIGIEAPESFHVEHKTVGIRKIGHIVHTSIGLCVECQS